MRQCQPAPPPHSRPNQARWMRPGGGGARFARKWRLPVARPPHPTEFVPAIAFCGAAVARIWHSIGDAERCVMDAAVVPIRNTPRVFGEDEALAWLRDNGPVQLSNAALARAWGWNATKVSRRLKAWQSAGLIERTRQGITAAAPRVESSAPALALAPAPAESEPASAPAEPELVEPPVEAQSAPSAQLPVPVTVMLPAAEPQPALP